MTPAVNLTRDNDLDNALADAEREFDAAYMAASAEIRAYDDGADDLAELDLRRALVAPNRWSQLLTELANGCPPSHDALASALRTSEPLDPSARLARAATGLLLCAAARTFLGIEAVGGEPFGVPAVLQRIGALRCDLLGRAEVTDAARRRGTKARNYRQKEVADRNRR